MGAPLELNYSRASRTLTLRFAAERYELSAELLRVLSPSAEVRGHSSEQAKLQTGKKNVAITQIVPTGNYGVRLVFDDGHDTGIYSWDYLEDLGRNRDRLWQDYLAELKAAGATREPLIARQFDPRQPS
ncbi:MAG: DUF971 domain-containing protein [Pseudomonadota bacterium]